MALQLGEAAQAAAFPSIAAAESELVGAPSFVLVIGPSFSGPNGMAEVGLFTRARPDTPVVLVAEVLTTDLLQRAMRAGIRDVVALSEDAAPLRQSVERASDHQGGVVPQGPPVGDRDERGIGRGRIITVFSAKGGAGKSFVATNLAAVLAGRNDKPVVLIDADLQFGDVAVMLGIEPHHTILEAVDAIDRLDMALLLSLLVEHEPSGLYVLPAPLEPAFADAVGLPHIRRILDVLTTFCSHVVIDTPTSFDDIVLGVLEQADDIVLLAGMDIPHIKNTKIALQTLRLLHVPSAKIKLTLNRADSKVKLDIADVERTLQIKADCLLPSDIAVPQSINEGVPIVIDAPGTGVARNLERLADLFPAWATETSGRA